MQGVIHGSMLQSRQNRDHRRQPISAHCAPHQYHSHPLNFSSWLPHFWTLYDLYMKHELCNIFPPQKIPKRQVPCSSPCTPGSCFRVFCRWQKNMVNSQYAHPPVLPGVAFPTRWKTNDGQTGRNGCWQEICYWSPTWGNRPIFEVGYIEYLIIDILTIRH